MSGQCCCPCCGATVSLATINEHLDRCTTSATAVHAADFHPHAIATEPAAPAQVDAAAARVRGLGATETISPDGGAHGTSPNHGVERVLLQPLVGAIDIFMADRRCGVPGNGLLEHGALFGLPTELWHYRCVHPRERVDDRGWGCAYRCVQMQCSALQLPVPSIVEIQQGLAAAGRLTHAEVGTSKWIEPPDGAAFLRHRHNVQSEELDIRRAGPHDALLLAGRLWDHFGDVRLASTSESVPWRTTSSIAKPLRCILFAARVSHSCDAGRRDEGVCDLRNRSSLGRGEIRGGIARARARARARPRGWSSGEGSTTRIAAAHSGGWLPGWGARGALQPRLARTKREWSAALE
eukprot:SAG11_NODE_284_length_11240_cov_6.333812_11_plen_351_part_00